MPIASHKTGRFNALAQSGAIFEAYGDIPFIRWHHYVRIKIRAYLEA